MPEMSFREGTRGVRGEKEVKLKFVEGREKWEGEEVGC